MRLCRALVLGYYAAVLAVLGPLLLAGSSHRAPHVTPEPVPEPPKRLEAATLPTPEPSSSPTQMVAPPPAPVVLPPPPVPALTKPPIISVPIPQPGGAVSTLATHYARFPPLLCWDGAGRHDVPRTVLFVAIRNMPCGLIVLVSGPLGTVRASVEDHGPNTPDPRRGLDASDEVFAATVGPLSIGVAQVTWVPVG